MKIINNKFIQIIKNLSYLVITVISLFYNSQIVIAQCNISSPDSLFNAYIASCNAAQLDTYFLTTYQNGMTSAAFCESPGLTKKILGANENNSAILCMTNGKGSCCQNNGTILDCAYDGNTYYSPNCPPAAIAIGALISTFPGLPATAIGSSNQDLFCPTGWVISSTDPQNGNYQYCPSIAQLCKLNAPSMIAKVNGCANANFTELCASAAYQTCVQNTLNTAPPPALASIQGCIESCITGVIQEECQVATNPCIQDTDAFTANYINICKSLGLANYYIENFNNSVTNIAVRCGVTPLFNVIKPESECPLYSSHDIYECPYLDICDANGHWTKETNWMLPAPVAPASPSTTPIPSTNRDAYCPTGWVSNVTQTPNGVYQYCPGSILTATCQVQAATSLAQISGCQGANSTELDILINNLCTSYTYLTCFQAAVPNVETATTASIHAATTTCLNTVDYTKICWETCLGASSMLLTAAQSNAAFNLNCSAINTPANRAQLCNSSTYQACISSQASLGLTGAGAIASCVSTFLLDCQSQPPTMTLADANACKNLDTYITGTPPSGLGLNLKDNINPTDKDAFEKLTSYNSDNFNLLSVANLAIENASQSFKRPDGTWENYKMGELIPEYPLAMTAMINYIFDYDTINAARNVPDIAQAPVSRYINTIISDISVATTLANPGNANDNACMYGYLRCFANWGATLFNEGTSNISNCPYYNGTYSGFRANLDDQTIPTPSTTMPPNNGHSPNFCANPTLAYHLRLLEICQAKHDAFLYCLEISHTDKANFIAQYPSPTQSLAQCINDQYINLLGKTPTGSTCSTVPSDANYDPNCQAIRTLQNDITIWGTNMLYAQGCCGQLNYSCNGAGNKSSLIATCSTGDNIFSFANDLCPNPCDSNYGGLDYIGAIGNNPKLSKACSVGSATALQFMGLSAFGDTGMNQYCSSGKNCSFNSTTHQFTCLCNDPGTAAAASTVILQDPASPPNITANTNICLALFAGCPDPATLASIYKKQNAEITIDFNNFHYQLIVPAICASAKKACLATCTSTGRKTCQEQCNGSYDACIKTGCGVPIIQHISVDQFPRTKLPTYVTCNGNADCNNNLLGTGMFAALSSTTGELGPPNNDQLTGVYCSNSLNGYILSCQTEGPRDLDGQLYCRYWPQTDAPTLEV